MTVLAKKLRNVSKHLFNTVRRNAVCTPYQAIAFVKGSCLVPLGEWLAWYPWVSDWCKPFAKVICWNLGRPLRFYLASIEAIQAYLHYAWLTAHVNAGLWGEPEETWEEVEEAEAQTSPTTGACHQAVRWGGSSGRFDPWTNRPPHVITEQTPGQRWHEGDKTMVIVCRSIPVCAIKKSFPPQVRLMNLTQTFPSYFWCDPSLS